MLLEMRIQFITKLNIYIVSKFEEKKSSEVL
jgi:hypothetical protein